MGHEDRGQPAPDVSREHRFVADAMLGRLARWLRFLGFDTLYYPHISDSRLVRIAMEQERTILTRDTGLVKRKGIREHVLLVHASDPFEQLVEVKDALHLSESSPLSRCVACNGLLDGVTDKSDIKDSVPDYVFLKVDAFFRCRECGRVYWEGSHPKLFKKKLRGLFNH
ncbi:MAG: Mut7-C RNAse domain-containing protein [Nitrospirota bacterium]